MHSVEPFTSDKYWGIFLSPPFPSSPLPSLSFLSLLYPSLLPLPSP